MALPSPCKAARKAGSVTWAVVASISSSRAAGMGLAADGERAGPDGLSRPC